MKIRRCHIDMSALDSFVVFGMSCRQRSGVAKNARKSAFPVSGNMKNHEEGGRKILRQAGDHYLQTFDTAAGCPDDYDVVPRHGITYDLLSLYFVNQQDGFSFGEISSIPASDLFIEVSKSSRIVIMNLALSGPMP